MEFPTIDDYKQTAYYLKNMPFSTYTTFRGKIMEDSVIKVEFNNNSIRRETLLSECDRRGKLYDQAWGIYLSTPWYKPIKYARVRRAQQCLWHSYMVAIYRMRMEW